MFGEIIVPTAPYTCPEMNLNNAGRIITTVWNQIPDHYPGIDIDEFMVMPNHIHGIIIVGAGPCACPENKQQPRFENWQGQPRGVAPTGLSLPDIIHRFKTMTTKQYTDGVKRFGWQPFQGKLWQRNYYEHIVRDDEELNAVRQYIRDNPLKWESDSENPMNLRTKR